MRVKKRSPAIDDGDPVALKLVLDYTHLVADGDRQPLHQVVDREMLFETVALAVESTLRPAGEVEHRLAQGLAGDGAGMDGNTAHHVAPFDDGRAFTELGGLNGGPLAGRAATDDQEIVIKHGFTLRVCFSRKRMCAGHALHAGLDANREVWLFQMSGEQQRHACNAWPAPRVEYKRASAALHRLPMEWPLAACCVLHPSILYSNASFVFC